jgi:hypothetical protein
VEAVEKNMKRKVAVLVLILGVMHLALSVAAQAQQQAKIYKIGWLGSRPAVREVVDERSSEIIRRELRALGYLYRGQKPSFRVSIR